MEKVTYEELVDYALHGAKHDGIAKFLDCPVVFQANSSEDALMKFQKYLKDSKAKK